MSFHINSSFSNKRRATDDLGGERNKQARSEITFPGGTYDKYLAIAPTIFRRRAGDDSVTSANPTPIVAVVQIADTDESTLYSSNIPKQPTSSSCPQK